jgi:hypothetical protein
MIKFLLWVGFVARNHDDTIVWPFHVSPKWIRAHHWKHDRRIYFFRNLPGVIKWVPGRLLPRRWGIGFCGIEFGDRGH